MKINVPFDEFADQNKNRIYYHIHRLHIGHEHIPDYFQEGMCALWQAYNNHQPDKGSLTSYLNYVIYYRLCDHKRKTTQQIKKEKDFVEQEKYQQICFQLDAITDPYMWKEIEALLTENQWKWVLYFDLLGFSTKEIAVQENTTVNAVKSWGRQARKKLIDADCIKALIE